MKKLTLFLACGLVLALLAGGTATAQSDARGDSKEKLERELHRLKLENWLLKIMIKNPSYIKKVGLDAAAHKTLVGFEVQPLTDEERAALSLGPKDGLKIVSVTGEAARKAGIREGDVIARFQSPFGRAVTARPDRWAVGFLPGDKARLVLWRGDERLVVTVPVTCSCGAGDKCPFHSPLATMSSYMAKARMRSNESSAIGSLKTICTGQEMFRASNCVDQDADGIGEFGLLAELAGARAFRGSEERCERNPYVPGFMGKLDKQGRARKSGYYLILYLPGKDKAMCDADVRPAEHADLQEEQYVAYAFPIEPGKTGTRVFGVSASGEIMCLDNKDHAWGGDKIPPPGLAFRDGKDLSTGAVFVRHGYKGGAATAWYTLGSRPPSGGTKKRKKPVVRLSKVLKLFESVWQAAVDEYCKVWMAAEDRTGLDLKTFMDKHAQKAGYKDFSDMCVAAAKSDPQAYSSLVKRLSSEMTARIQRMLEEETERLKEKAGAKKGEDEKKAGGDIFLAFEKAWMAAVNEYCAARKAATDKAGIDLQPILDAKAKEAGFKDWIDYATKVATASADRYKRIVERMSKYISLRMAELEKKESEKPKDGGDEK